MKTFEIGKQLKPLRKNKRKEAILDVAASAFLEQGLSAVSMNWIAEKSGGSKATLWRHFSSKEALFEAVLNREINRFKETTSISLSKDEGTEASLYHFCLEYLIMVTSQDAITLIRLVLSEVNRFPNLGNIFYEQGPAYFSRQLEEYIENAMLAGKLNKRGDSSQATNLIISMCLSGAHQKLLYGIISEVDKVTLEQEATHIVETFFRVYGI